MTERTYTVMNDADGNDSFKVSANSREEALEIALENLGWNLFGGDE